MNDNRHKKNRQTKKKTKIQALGLGHIYAGEGEGSCEGEILASGQWRGLSNHGVYHLKKIKEAAKQQEY